jgi:hypothetical protein
MKHFLLTALAIAFAVIHVVAQAPAGWQMRAVRFQF